MDSMIERVARAICKVSGTSPDAYNQNGFNGKQWSLYVDEARAAIAAMRLTHQGDLALGKVGATTIFSDYDGDQTCAQVVIDGWNSIIASALKEVE